MGPPCFLTACLLHGIIRTSELTLLPNRPPLSANPSSGASPLSQLILNHPASTFAAKHLPSMSQIKKSQCPKQASIYSYQKRHTQHVDATVPAVSNKQAYIFVKRNKHNNLSQMSP